MLKKLKIILFTYPQQILLALLNLTVFVWMQLSSSQVATQLGLVGTYQQHVPDWLRTMTGNSLEGFRSFLTGSSWAWLLSAVILLLIWRFISKLVRLFLFLLIMGGGLWLLWQNQEILRQMMN